MTLVLMFMNDWVNSFVLQGSDLNMRNRLNPGKILEMMIQ